MFYSGFLFFFSRKFLLASLFCYFAWGLFCCFAAVFMVVIGEVVKLRQDVSRLKQELDAALTSLIHFDFAHATVRYD
jgi:uncharacterized membrane protein YccC